MVDGLDAHSGSGDSNMLDPRFELASVRYG